MGFKRPILVEEEQRKEKHQFEQVLVKCVFGFSRR
jgi:hypothetical protein